MFRCHRVVSGDGGDGFGVRESTPAGEGSHAGAGVEAGSACVCCVLCVALCLVGGESHALWGHTVFGHGYVRVFVACVVCAHLGMVWVRGSRKRGVSFEWARIKGVCLSCVVVWVCVRLLRRSF